MEPVRLAELNKHYRVLTDTLVTEGRVFSRGDCLTPMDAPGEIESLLHAGIIEPTEKPAPKSGGSLL